jgi:RNA polymerase sigma factor (sigma-70 family)
MRHYNSSAEADQITAAQAGDGAAYERLVAEHRGRLHAYCYRMLGSVHDADDAVQETLLAAWRGLGQFEGRSSLRSWLYRIATHACLRLITNRRRVLASEHGPPAKTPTTSASRSPNQSGSSPTRRPSRPTTQPTRRPHYQERESVELAFVAALQHLPAGQRAVLILREDGTVYHSYSAYARGCDVLWGMWQWLDRAPLGRNEGDMSWFHRHDEYPASSYTACSQAI